MFGGTRDSVISSRVWRFFYDGRPLGRLVSGIAWQSGVFWGSRVTAPCVSWEMCAHKLPAVGVSTTG